MDLEKDKYLKSIGYPVLRFEEKEVITDINNIIRTIELTINEIERELSPLEKGE